MNEYLEWQIRVYGRGAGGGTTRRGPQPVTKKRIRAIQLGRCLYCGLTIGTRVKRSGKVVALTAQWDHFVPFSYLAENPEANWVLACQVCNGIKNDRMFKTVEEARAVILRAREAKGYEAVAETTAKQESRKPRTKKAAAKPKSKSKSKPAKKATARNVPAPRTPIVRILPEGAVSHGCGAWWTGNRRSHCPSCCQTFATERVALLHREGEGADRRCLPPQQVGLVPTDQPWGTCWEKSKTPTTGMVTATPALPLPKEVPAPLLDERWKPTRVSSHRRQGGGSRAFTTEQLALAGDLQARAMALWESSEEGISISEAVELAAVQIRLDPARAVKGEQ